MENKKSDKNIIRSFGRIANRMSKQEQKQLDEKLDKFTITIQQAKELTDVFPDKKIFLDVGCGKGEQIIQHAKDNPENIYIACEVFKNSLMKIVKEIETSKLENLFLFYDDSRMLLENLEPESIDHTSVLYPDPWPKSKQKKRRIVNEDFLDLVYKATKQDGTLLLATDITDYALWMLKHVLNHGKFNCIAQYPEEWAKEPENWVTTSYEKKAREFGRKSWYLQFTKAEITPQFTKANTVKYKDEVK